MSGNEQDGLERLEAEGIRSVVVAAPDMQGRLFGRRMSPAQLRQRLGGFDVCTCALAWDIEQELGLDLEYAGFHSGWHDLVLVPDLSTLRPLAWLDGVAFCFADLREKEGGPVPISPRSMLELQVERLAELGYEAQIGGELEFYLYQGSYEEARENGYRELRPTTQYHADYLVTPGNLAEPFFRRLRDGLEGSGVELELEQGEWGLGQWEINMRHNSPLRMADNHALFKLGTRETAALEGMCATFMARPSNDALGSSGHVHVSLLDGDGDFVFFDSAAADRLSELFRWSVGGILAHAADFMAWYAPTVNSYRRVAREEMVAGSGVTWGYDNRTASVRTIGSSPPSLHLEFRLPGADSNPYLVYAALLASVIEGITGKLDPGEPVIGSAYEREARGGLPENLGEAAARLRESEVARRAFGNLAVDHYGTVAAFEWQQFMAVVGEWETARYFEQI